MPKPNATAGGSFRDLKLSEPLLTALDEVGYETPSPIQAQAIPHLLKGLDLLGHAPTGTGKTAAFALPLMSRINLNDKAVQIMTLTPTRELAIQVAEAFQRYAAHIKGFHVLPIYGGSDYTGQIRALKRGVHVVVGTPGRVMDHMRKGTLKLGGLQALVLDEADGNATGWSAAFTSWMHSPVSSKLKTSTRCWCLCEPRWRLPRLPSGWKLAVMRRRR